MMRRGVLSCLALAAVACWAVAAAADEESYAEAVPAAKNSLRVAAFNIQVFGVSKMSDPAVVNILKQILIRYDITLIQEIRDATDTAIHQLLAEVNSMGAGTWQMVLSERLGRTSSKEQYAYFYKTSTVSVVSQYQWPDTADVYEREPFIVRFRASAYAVPDICIMGIHVKPEDAVNELDKLVDVYNSMVSMWGTSNFLIAGDLNADCSYVGSGDWTNIRLRTDSRFLWTISDAVDTTVTATNCAYDRLVVAGNSLQNTYIGGSAIPFNYESYYGINNALALDVSDHYPVEMSFD